MNMNETLTEIERVEAATLEVLEKYKAHVDPAHMATLSDREDRIQWLKTRAEMAATIAVNFGFVADATRAVLNAAVKGDEGPDWDNLPMH